MKRLPAQSWQTTYPTCSSQVKPDLVLYDAGVDPHHTDQLGKLALTSCRAYTSVTDLY
jgi:acetoin utilization deacetylase AcuC-like enzyme